LRIQGLIKFLVLLIEREAIEFNFGHSEKYLMASQQHRKGNLEFTEKESLERDQNVEKRGLC